MVCDGVHLFAISATCPDAVSVEWDCQSFCSCNTHESVCALPFQTFLWLFWLKRLTGSSLRLWANVSVCTQWDFIHVCLVTKTKFVETIFLITILLTCCQYRSRSQRIIAVLWVRVKCLLYSRQSSARLMIVDHEEDLDNFPLYSAENWSERAESVVGAYRAESTWAAVLRKFHHSLMG